MKMIYLISGVVIISLFVFYLINPNKSKAATPADTHQLPDSGKKQTKLKENPYPGMRDNALSRTSEELNLKLDENRTIAYGVIMDWHMGDYVVTVVSYQTGDASIYISAGQIMIGGYAHENIKNAALAFVDEAQKYLSSTKKTEKTPLPDKGSVRFYFLTNKGKYFLQEKFKNIENKNSTLTKLFDLGNNVITEYRISSQKLKK